MVSTNPISKPVTSFFYAEVSSAWEVLAGNKLFNNRFMNMQNFLDCMDEDSRSVLLHWVNRQENFTIPSVRLFHKWNEEQFAISWEVMISKTGDRNHFILIGQAYDNVSANETAGQSDLIQSVNRKYKAIIKNSSEAILLLSKEGVATEVSTSGKNFLGYTEKDIFGQKREDIIHKDDIARLQTAFVNVMLQPGNSETVEFRLVREEAYHWLECTFSNQLNDRDVESIVVVTRDIHPRKSAEEQLSQHRFYIDLLFNNTEDAFIIIDKNLKVIGFNKLAKTLAQDFFGQQLKEGISVLSFSPASRCGKAEELYKSLFKGVKHKREQYYTGISRQNACFETSFLPIYNDDKEIVAALISSRDVTEKKLLESKYEKLIETINGVVWEGDPETLELTYINKRVEEIIGYSVTECLQPGFWKSLVHPDDFSQLLTVSTNKFKEKEDFFLEFRLKCSNGEYIWIKCLVTINVENDKSVSVKGLLFDITAEKAFVQKLQENEERFKALVHNSFDAILLLETDGRIRYVSPSVKSIFGFEEQELVQKNAMDLILAEDLEMALKAYEEIIREPGLSVRISVRISHKNGQTLTLEVMAKNMADHASLNGLLLNVRDITDRKRLEAELLQQEVVHQQQVIQAAITAQEKEKEEIAKDLHDNINQLMSAARLMLETAISNEAVRERFLVSSFDTLSKAIGEVRTLSSSLLVYDLQDLGLCESVRRLQAKFAANTGVKMLGSLNENVDAELSSKAKVHLFRIIQEQLNNVARHAKATELTITLDQKRNGIVLAIKDNGVGFDTKEQKRGVGFSNIMNRVLLLNGKISIESKLGKGCTLSVVVPVNK